MLTKPQPNKLRETNNIMPEPNTVLQLTKSLEECAIIYDKIVPNQEIWEALKDSEGGPEMAFSLCLHEGMQSVMERQAKAFYQDNPEALLENPLPVATTIWNFVLNHPLNNDYKSKDTLPELFKVCKDIIGVPEDPTKIKALCDKVASQMFDEEENNYGDGLYFRSHYDEQARKTFVFLYNENQNGRQRFLFGYPSISAEDQKLVDEHAAKVIKLSDDPKDGNIYYIWKDDEAEVPEAFINFLKKTVR